VLVLGAGVAGLSAIGTARRLGAAVTGYDVRPETRAEIESLGAKFLVVETPIEGGGTGGYARSLTPEEQRAQQDDLEDRLAAFDVIITTALVPGRRPPLLVSEAALGKMRRGSVVVDMAAGPHGGNVAGSAPATTVVTGGGVTVIGASDLPASVATASSDAFSQNMAAALAMLVRDGELVLDFDDAVQQAVVLTEGGRVLGEPPVAAPVIHEQEPDERIAAV
jgi:NAD(P) transhydrogenase subunit alpha